VPDGALTEAQAQAPGARATMEFSTEYANFRAWVPRNVLPVGALNPQDWVYYDWGPRTFGEPLLCLHPVVGSAESFYRQVLSLAERGYRVIAPQLPVYWSPAEFCDGLHTFLDMLHVRRVHIYGAGLGGFLAFHYAARRPDRVSSIATTHAFVATDSVAHNIVYSSSVLRWLPEFLVRSAVRSLFPKGRAELFVAEAAEFAIANTMAVSRDHLASRLSLLVTASTVVGRLRIPDTRVTMIDVIDVANPASSTDDARQALPHARHAMLKSGGEFPYLAAPDDVVMHLVIHLRRNAAPPENPIPPPPQARARSLLHAETHRYTEATAVVAAAAIAAAKPANDKSGSSACDVVVDFKAAAEEKVATDERARMQVWAAQMSTMREFVTDRDDQFLFAALLDCEGDADKAVQKIRDGAYGKRFQAKARRRAVRDAETTLRNAAETAQKMKATEAAKGDGCMDVSSEDADAASVAIAAVASETLLMQPTDAKVPTLLVSSGSEPVSCSDVVAGAVEHAASINSSTARQPASAVAGGTDCTDDASTKVEYVNLRGTNEPRQTQPGASNPLQGASSVLESAFKAPSAPKASAVRAKGHASRSREATLQSQRPQGRVQVKERYPPETDSVAAYVTSKKIGMQTSGPLVGRGPTPFSTGDGSSQPRQQRRQRQPASDTTLGKRAARGNQNAGASGSKRDDDTEGDGGGYANDDAPGPASTALEKTELANNQAMAPVQGGVSPLQMRGRLDASARKSLATEPAADNVRENVAATVFQSDEDDGWGKFRQRGLLSMESDLDDGTVVVEVGSGEIGQCDEDVEAARLREWKMSAQSATESATRK
jgi:maspardin